MRERYDLGAISSDRSVVVAAYPVPQARSLFIACTVVLQNMYAVIVEIVTGRCDE